MTDDQLSDDPEENIRMENELLRLKLLAELGGKSHTEGDIPPEIENQFLKHVLEFEQHYANSERVTVYEKLGRPAFKKAEELDDKALAGALEEITGLLAENSIAIDYGAEYDGRTKYSFITEELFGHEMDGFMMEGMTTHYIYEEFHPNHQLDIESRTVDFLRQWFKQSLDEKSWELSNVFILPTRKTLSKTEVAAIFKQIFDSYNSFTDEEYVIHEISFKLQEGSGLGHAEGTVKYNAVLESGETVHFNGPFKFYFEFDGGWWSIFHIVLPGFKYE